MQYLHQASPVAALENPMSLFGFGFPRSTFVKLAGLILTARNVDYDFHEQKTRCTSRSMSNGSRMDAQPDVVRFNAKLPPRPPIQHARKWVHHHRPAA